MAYPRAFISFDYDNNSGEKMYFSGQAVNSRTPFNIQDWSSKFAINESKWEEVIEAKIAKCNLMIVLVGRSMSTAIGVHKEIAMAQRQRVPVFGVYVDSANTLTTLPPGLSRNRVISWNWEGIASKIDQMMNEGKNSIL